MHVPLPKAMPLLPYAALGFAQYREQLRNAPRAKRMPCPLPNCDRFFMQTPMRSHIARHFLRGHRWAGQKGADKGAFCLWCGNTDGKCSTSVYGKKIDCNCTLAYYRLRLNSAATATAMNPSSNLPVRCKVLDCRKNGIAPTPCHTTWHKHTPVCLMTMPGAAKRRKHRCCKPLTISGPHCHRRRSLLRRRRMIRMLQAPPLPASREICLWFVTRGREALWANSRQHLVLLTCCIAAKQS